MRPLVIDEKGSSSPKLELPFFFVDFSIIGIYEKNRADRISDRERVV